MSIKIEKTEVYGWEAAIRGMRNPMNSWNKSDSFIPCYLKTKCHECEANQKCAYYFEDGLPYKKDEFIGPKDLNLMTRLRNAGPEHAKFLRMIAVTCDITAPLYWWKEFDTYKVGTVANSCSTMHKIMEKPFEIDDFSHEHLADMSFGIDLMPEPGDRGVIVDASPFYDGSILYSPKGLLQLTIRALNQYRDTYLKIKEKPTKDISKKNECLENIWWQVIQILPSSYNQKRTVFLNYWVLANIYHQRQHHKQDEWRVSFCDWIKSLPYSNLITGDESK